MRRAAAAVLAVVAGGLAACGSPSPDLFEVTRSGDDPNADVRLVVSDSGSVTCNGGEAKPLPGEMLLEARELARALEKQAALSIELPAENDSTLRYEVSTQAGGVAFSDTSRGRPKTFDRLVAFTKTAVEDICGISR